jgi:C-1 hydroxylase
MHLPGRKFANFGLFLCICPVTLTAGVTADKEASMTTTTAESPAAAQLEANKLEANKAVIRSFVDAWNNRDFGRFEALMGQDAVLRIGGAVVPCDPASTRAIAEEWTTAFPDWRFDLRALIAEGDRVVAHMPYSGTHRQPILGIAPTNRPCSVDEIVIFRVSEGKITEAWEVYDEAGMWRQLGVLPPDAPGA